MEASEEDADRLSLCNILFKVSTHAEFELVNDESKMLTLLHNMVDNRSSASALLVENLFRDFDSWSPLDFIAKKVDRVSFYMSEILQELKQPLECEYSASQMDEWSIAASNSRGMSPRKILTWSIIFVVASCGGVVVESESDESDVNECKVPASHTGQAKSEVKDPTVEEKCEVPSEFPAFQPQSATAGSKTLGSVQCLDLTPDQLRMAASFGDLFSASFGMKAFDLGVCNGLGEMMDVLLKAEEDGGIPIDEYGDLV